jgi:hypothetical protein
VTRTAVTPSPARFSPRLRVGLAALTLSLAACAVDDGPVTDFATASSADEPIDPTTTAPPVVAELRTADGAHLIFINDGTADEPAIGVEILSDTTTPHTDAIFDHEPSALELFLAVAPDKPAPQELVREHARLAAGSTELAAEPRVLAVASATGEGVVPYTCTNTQAWINDFSSWAPTLAGQYIQTNESGLTTGYVGYNPRFYFDICRPYDVVSHPSTYFTGVQRRLNASYGWLTINAQTGGLNYQMRRWRYYRNTFTCSSYEYRLLVSSGQNRYHRAARWANPWSCQIGLGT